MMEEKDNWREILNKEWSKDFPSLPIKEVQKIIRMAFYQLFLIEVDSIKITSEVNSSGLFIKMEIEGEAFMDAANLESEYIEENEEED